MNKLTTLIFGKQLFIKVVRMSFLISVITLLGGFLMPQDFTIPVENNMERRWDNETFWYYSWGESIVHKGVDIFSPKGTKVFAATDGLVLETLKTGNGGNTIKILGPKWRIHYYAHLEEVLIKPLSIVKCGQVIGKVGNTGNAATTPPHLHYSIETVIPYLWRWDRDVLGWKKVFYLNPLDYMGQYVPTSLPQVSN